MLTKQSFQQLINGRQTDLFFLKNNSGSEVTITNFGARIVSIVVPNKKNELIDIVMGFDNLEQYRQADCPYYGATIGRAANRIARAQFSLHQTTYTLVANEGKNHLHGGPEGFHNVIWSLAETKKNSLKLNYRSKDREQGYPGNLNVSVHFILTEDNELHIHYEASCDKLSILNLTNHAFFNLNGEYGQNILNHTLLIDADHYTPVDAELIPTGSIDSVAASPFDFRVERTIGERINEDHDQLKLGNGYDHNFVLNKESNPLGFAAKIAGDLSGIEMSIYTTEPGLQFYSGNKMLGTNTFKHGHKDNFRTAFALETQHFPDSPNHNTFPSIEIAPHQTFHSTSIYKFSVNPK